MWANPKVSLGSTSSVYEHTVRTLEIEDGCLFMKVIKEKMPNLEGERA